MDLSNELNFVSLKPPSHVNNPFVGFFGISGA